MRHPSPRPRAILLPVLLLVVACGGGGDGGDAAAAPAGPRFESPELGIAIASLPAGFEVVGFRNGALELSHESGGDLTMVAEAPEAGGVNLVEAVRGHHAEIQGRPGGVYRGQQELMTVNLGTAYYSRGVWEDGGAVREETAVFLVHPTGDRLLRVLYRYPSDDDSQARIQDQLFAVVGELEGFGTPAEAVADPGVEEAESGAGAPSGGAEDAGPAAPDGPAGG